MSDIRDIKINFNGKDSFLLLNDDVCDKDAYTQKCLVNLVTSAGTDKLYDERGTDLLRTAASGAIINKASANHECNAASINTLFFVRGYDRKGIRDVPWRALDINMNIVDFAPGNMVTNVIVLFQDETTTKTTTNFAL
ncbi:MAG: hypothetical protein RR382_00325 [Tannerellaceae bacterium]